MPRAFSIIEQFIFYVFSKHLPIETLEYIDQADVIYVESGIGIIYLQLLKRINPDCKIIYLASDSLESINQSDYISTALKNSAHLLFWARLPSPYLATEIPCGVPVYFIPHGIDKKQFSCIEASPYSIGTINAVSIGSMLFDRSFFEIAATLLPYVNFHIIGSGVNGGSQPNLIFYAEMEFSKTLPFLKHANFAIAAYGEGVASYLTHTSMKLMQYDYLGLPAVCPNDVVGTSPMRFGYDRGSDKSIEDALNKALETSQTTSSNQLSWDDVTDRLLNPSAFSDTAL